MATGPPVVRLDVKKDENLRDCSVLAIRLRENEDEELEGEEDFSLFVKKFHKFVKKRRIERRQNFNHGKRFQ